jgi:hypothetical protein
MGMPAGNGRVNTKEEQLMITEVRVIGTGERLWRDELPDGTAVHVYNNIVVEWMEIYMDEHWITLSAPAKVTRRGGILLIEELPPKPEPEPELPDELLPVNYTPDWSEAGREIIGGKLDWEIATVYAGITQNGINMDKGNLSLVKNAPRVYGAMIALYNQYMKLREDFDPDDELEALREVASVASDIQGECK